MVFLWHKDDWQWSVGEVIGALFYGDLIHWFEQFYLFELQYACGLKTAAQAALSFNICVKINSHTYIVSLWCCYGRNLII